MTLKREKTLQIPLGVCCNNNCIFCMESRDMHKERKTIPISFYKKTIMDAVGKFQRVGFTSAEPTLYEGLPSLIKYAKKLNFPEIYIITNGRRFSYSSFLDKLIDSGLNMVGVSIHGHDRRLHESLTRTPGSFEQTKKGLQNVKKRRQDCSLKSFTINCTVNKFNFQYLSEIYDFFEQYNPDEIIYNYLNPIGRITTKFKLLMPRYHEVSKILNKMYLRGKRKFTLVDFPPCTVLDVLPQLGSIEDYHIRNMEKKNDIEYSRESLSFKSKPPKCKRCVYYSTCHGINEIYIKEYGDEEFNPISKEKLETLK